jgi:hypothetical protein
MASHQSEGGHKCMLMGRLISSGVGRDDESDGGFVGQTGLGLGLFTVSEAAQFLIGQ